MSRIAGQRRNPEQPVLRVDYADVLDQAVENERWRTLREARQAICAIPTTEMSGYSPKDRRVDLYARDIKAAIDRLMDRPAS